MKRFWVSWWSGNWGDEGCTKPPFQTWVTGQRERADLNDHREQDRDECSMVAVIDAENEDQIWRCIKKHFPDFEKRFCEDRPADWQPGNRFPNYENLTKMVT